jgi:class 3 adenylate cyclase
MLKKSRIVTSVFIDIEDSTGISNYFEKDKYEKFLTEFFKTIQKVITKNEWKIIAQEQHRKFMGDEFIAFFPHDELKERTLESALRLAATLKYEWYFSQYNRDRILGDKEIIELNIGINTGDVSLMTYPGLSNKKGKPQKSFEGFPITLAKRMQSVAEESQSSRIVVADRFYREYSSTTQRGHEFQYMGKKSFKGIAQRFSCYEWLGSYFYEEYLDFKEDVDRKVKQTLTSLYDRNPHNPWYAALLANYYFSLGEDEYRTGNEDNEFYKECAKVCLRSIQNIHNYNLRELNELFFTCLEVGNKWEELCFRTERAFANDPTFSSALSLNAKSLYMLGEDERAKEVANRLIILFQHSLDYESLFDAHFILSRYYAKKIDKEKTLHHIRASVSFAQKDDLDWAYLDFVKIEDKEFDYIKHKQEYKTEIKKLKIIFDKYNK